MISRKIIILILLIVLIAGGFAYKLLVVRMSHNMQATYTGLHPFKLILGQMSIITPEGTFRGRFINTLNESVRITKLDLTNIECSYGHRSLFKKIKCLFHYRTGPSCKEKHYMIIGDKQFDTFPYVVGPEKEFILTFPNCETFKNKHEGDWYWVNLSIEYSVENKTSLSWGIISSFYR